MIKIIYHSSDLDGQCAAAIAKIKCEDNGEQHELIGADYTEDEDKILSKISHGDSVYVLDFSFTIEKMKILDILVGRGKLIWIDHHESKIVDADKHNFDPEGIRQVGKAACELCMEYFFPQLSTSRAVYYLGRYDVWDHEHNPDILAFQYGMRLHDWHPSKSSEWRRVILINDIDLMNENITIGYKILDFVRRQNEEYASYCAFEATFENLRAIVLNKGSASSMSFDSVYDPDKHDIMVSFVRAQNEWAFTLYCDKDEINVGEIAKKYGGGGHKGAAGFVTNELPLLLVQ